ncbi:SDR family NAD(P)-dependent oxidoreductase [Pseudooceanicola spongiae]|jgi:NAD(P)-dependent dehydrogenase (short-subunit alcohol dehydrogenase family)|uniref:SDR family NAD(P)-dependent oxidoreductase n=1 Tax=Pseudooceanicola spongiae TaxID=2613965 RepID=A0A7L9WR98_9RHOB|nr:SDR family NAD(P)-dependent oxidoreductase [Pseudooceanicola spongiae]QOL81610.1 SDR family NAD(P)-dependent oxidoreductase [Pseudooceanicola spongiae]
MDIKGIGAVVTGAGSGLGAATARHLASMGAKVGVFDFNEAGARAVAEEIGGLACPVNVADEGQVAAAFDDFIAWNGAAPRVLVNCAGIGTAGRVVNREGKLSIDAFRRTLDVNLIGSYITLSYAARAMAELEPVGPDNERGVIINTASVAYQDGQIGQAAYAASKGGIASLTLPVARELARSGIRVMGIAPGMFQTAMVDGLPEETQRSIAATIPFPPRFGSPSDYASLAEQIIRNTMLNGTVIRLDGAVRLPPK